MIHIETLSIGQPQMLIDGRRTWHSAIFRTPIAEPIMLNVRGLAGDAVADTKNHGSLNQAVCCQPLDHYAYWNAVYGLDTPDRMLRGGSVGENWTLSDATEHDVCIGDIFAVGEGGARVQVSAPRYPCTKQQRKLKLPRFHKRVFETLRTGFYLRVLTPGMVVVGDTLTLEARPQPMLTVQRINENGLGAFDPAFAQQLLEVPELAEGWKSILQSKLDGQWKD